MEPIILKSFVVNFSSSPIHDMWNLFNDITKCSHLLFSHSKIKMHSEPIFVVGKSSKELGSVFHVCLLSTVNMYFRVEKIVESDYWCHLQWKAYLSFLTKPIFQLTISFHSIDDTHCSIIHEMVQHIHYEFYLRETLLKFQMIKSLDSIIRQKDQYKVSIGTILIKSSFDHLIGLLLDWKKLKLNVPTCCEEVEYDDDELKKGTIIRLQLTPRCCRCENGEFIILKVIQVSIRDNDSFLLRLETIDCSETIPYQAIEYSLWKINKKKSYMVIKHIFNKALPRGFLEEYEKRKKNLLRKLKAYYESSYACDVFLSFAKRL